ncbi:hypothetical protein [Riemerella columbina]|uniref:hypothetical protein n=1 Tax=Riemerella columbina TaxID=103810 RepID=UPI00267034F6|nr:hypothetical protein [Riemerella columbina]WKS95312.1 hypothetical protein NYR17_00815 [Riemerella columbina]
MPLLFFAEILHNNILVPANYSISSPFWVLDEDGTMSEEDRLLQKEYIDCLKKDRSEVFILKPNQVKNFKLPLIDSADECGEIDYPILEKGKSYKVSVKLRLDSNIIPKKKYGKNKPS